MEAQYREGTLKHALVAVLKSVRPEALTAQGESALAVLAACVAGPRVEPAAAAAVVPARRLAACSARYHTPLNCHHHTAAAAVLCLPTLSPLQARWTRRRS